MLGFPVVASAYLQFPEGVVNSQMGIGEGLKAIAPAHGYNRLRDQFIPRISVQSSQNTIEFGHPVRGGLQVCTRTAWFPGAGYSRVSVAGPCGASREYGIASLTC